MFQHAHHNLQLFQVLLAPIFVNHDNVLRPIAGKRLMEVFLDPSSSLAVNTVSSIGSDMYDNLEKIATNFTYDAFVEMKNKHISGLT